jgi:ubiquinone/menaquinone biosynthesis C-methylase UbiE
VFRAIFGVVYSHSKVFAMQTKTAPLSAPPLLIGQIVHSTWAFSTLAAAVELDLFAPMSRGKQTAEEVAAKLKLDPAGTKVMLDGLAALDLTKKLDHSYELTQVSRDYLLKESNLYLGKYIEVARQSLSRTWDSLAQCVRTGKPAQEVNKEVIATQFFPALAEAIFPLSYSAAQMIVNHLQLSTLPKPARVLDVAAGSGVWSIPIAQANAGVKVDALDFPAVLEVTKKFATKYSVDSQFNYLAGDWRSVNLEPEAYDVVVIGHLLHSDGVVASEELLLKLHGALKPGGDLIVAEFMPDEQRTSPLFAVLFAINMFLQTTRGCVFTQAELERLLLKTGYGEIDRPELAHYGAQSPVIVAKNMNKS